jgi:glycosyltransferase involved in cell wall biosynthesis
VRICLVYDCLFPHTVGGAERWYRNLALRLRDEGHTVTYVTLRQWDRGEAPDLPGVEVVVAGPRMALYGGPGQRRILPPLVFGAGVLWHLTRRGRRYDVVHTASFPYFSVLAAGVARPLGRYRLVVDWHEWWTRGYWREYLGRAGDVGWWVQALCAKVPQRAFCFARLTASRLRDAGLQPTVLEGEYAGPLTPREPQPASDTVVFAGRHIPEKRVPAVVAAVAAVQGVRGVVFGDGPERGKVLAEIERLGAPVTAPGFVSPEEVERTLATALCMLLPSSREGYGMIVVESAAAGVPSVVVAAPDNAAVELVEEGVNGVIARSAEAADLETAVQKVIDAGPALREQTADWFARNAQERSLEASLAIVADSYESARS